MQHSQALTLFFLLFTAGCRAGSGIYHEADVFSPDVIAQFEDLGDRSSVMDLNTPFHGVFGDPSFREILVQSEVNFCELPGGLTILHNWSSWDDDRNRISERNLVETSNLHPLRPSCSPVEVVGATQDFDPYDFGGSAETTQSIDIILPDDWRFASEGWTSIAEVYLNRDREIQSIRLVQVRSVDSTLGRFIQGISGNQRPEIVERVVGYFSLSGRIGVILR